MAEISFHVPLQQKIKAKVVIYSENTEDCEHQTKAFDLNCKRRRVSECSRARKGQQKYDE